MSNDSRPVAVATPHRVTHPHPDLGAAVSSSLQALRLESGLLVKRSHDIRTPLNGMMGMSTLLMDTGLSDEQREYVSIIRASGRALLAVLDDILDFSTLSSSPLELRPVPLSLRGQLVETLRVFAVTSLPEDLELVCDIPAEVPDMVLADPQRLRQICMNLLSNAIRATAAGTVRLSVRQVSRDGQQAVLEFAVADTGTGIAPERQAGLFDAFVQVDPQARYQFGGVGLGLPLSAHLVALMGGTLTVDSQPGQGSRFSFRLPVTVHSSDQLALATRRAVPSLQGVAVDLAIAGEQTRALLAELLSNWGMRVRLQHPDDEMAERLKAGRRDGSVPQIAILDSGSAPRTLALAGRIRAAGLGNLPIIALVPGIRRDDAAEARRLGLAGLHTQPVGHNELLHSLHVALALTGPLATRPATHRNQGLKVLVAEDNPVNSLLVTRLLERQGHTVVAVRNGREAVERFKDGPFDAVLMDLIMPEMDGLEATRAIRALESGSGRRTPIIAVTAETLDRVEAACAAAGLDACVAKPLEPAAIVEALMSLVS